MITPSHIRSTTKSLSVSLGALALSLTAMPLAAQDIAPVAPPVAAQPARPVQAPTAAPAPVELTVPRLDSERDTVAPQAAADLERERADQSQSAPAPRRERTTASAPPRAAVAAPRAVTPVAPMAAIQPETESTMQGEATIADPVAPVTPPVEAQAVPPAETPVVTEQVAAEQGFDEEWLIGGGVLAALGLAGYALAGRRRRHSHARVDTAPVVATTPVAPVKPTPLRADAYAAEPQPARMTHLAPQVAAPAASPKHDPLFARPAPAAAISSDPLFAYRAPLAPVTDPLFFHKVDTPPITDPMFANDPNYAGPNGQTNAGDRGAARHQPTSPTTRDTRILEPAE